ncbi:MAG: PTS sugar transporter subunit IIA [Opitutaceae bacterium]|nr:PTS sugar transporter subunit IIA [Opitutaceae bacterium]
MSHRTFNIEELRDYLHLANGDVERLMREADLPHERRGGRLIFRRSAIDAWASQRILQLPEKRLDIYHEKSTRGTADVLPQAALIPELLHPRYIDLKLTSKTSASVLRDIVALAEKTDRLLDPRELLTSIVEREQLCSTALPGGVALPHPRNHEPYRYEGSFLVLGRTIQGVPFSAPDGHHTHLFILICCQDDRLHLHTLARLCVLMMKTDIIARLDEASSPEDAYNALVEAEKSVLPPLR